MNPRDILPLIATLTAFFVGLFYGVLAERTAERRRWENHLRYMQAETPKPSPTDDEWINEIEEQIRNTGA